LGGNVAIVVHIKLFYGQSTLCTSPQLHFKLNAIHGHATWQHHSPSPLKLKIEKRRCQIARFAGGPCTKRVQFVVEKINRIIRIVLLPHEISHLLKIKKLLLLDKLTDNSNDDNDDNNDNNNNNNNLYCDKSQQERGLRHEALIERR